MHGVTRLYKKYLTEPDLGRLTQKNTIMGISIAVLVYCILETLSLLGLNIFDNRTEMVVFLVFYGTVTAFGRVMVGQGWSGFALFILGPYLFFIVIKSIVLFCFGADGGIT